MRVEGGGKTSQKSLDTGHGVGEHQQSALGPVTLEPPGFPRGHSSDEGTGVLDTCNVCLYCKRD